MSGHLKSINFRALVPVDRISRIPSEEIVTNIVGLLPQTIRQTD
jgi:hypothetical protein